MTPSNSAVREMLPPARTRACRIACVSALCRTTRRFKLGGFVATQAGSPQEGTPVKLYAYDIAPYVPGDVNGDAQLTCADVAVATAAIGTRAGQAGYVRNADMDQDGVIEMRDVVAIRQLLPAGLRCK